MNNRLLTEEKYKAVLMAQGLPEVCCPYDADAIAVLKAQRNATLEEVKGIINDMVLLPFYLKCGLLKAIEGLE